MNIIVAGSRTIDDYDFVKRHLDRLTRKLDLTPYKSKVVIFSGGDEGVDKLGEQWAYEKRLTCRVFHADWKGKGKAAGPIRNGEMIKQAKALIAFWDGKSPGTKDVVEKAEKAELKVRVILWKIKNS